MLVDPGGWWDWYKRGLSIGLAFTGAVAQTGMQEFGEAYQELKASGKAGWGFALAEEGARAALATLETPAVLAEAALGRLAMGGKAPETLPRSLTGGFGSFDQDGRQLIIGGPGALLSPSDDPITSLGMDAPNWQTGFESRMRAQYPEISDDGWNRIMWQASTRFWSGEASMMAAIDRMAAGERPETVLNGKVEARQPLQAVLLTNITGVNADGQWQVVEEHLPLLEEAVRSDDDLWLYWRRQEDAGADMAAVATELVRNGIPAEIDVGRELIGQLIFDPLNLIGIGATGRREARWFEDSVSMMLKVDDTPIDELIAASQKGRTGIRRLYNSTPPARRAFANGSSGLAK